MKHTSHTHTKFLKGAGRVISFASLLLIFSCSKQLAVESESISTPVNQEQLRKELAQCLVELLSNDREYLDYVYSSVRDLNDANESVSMSALIGDVDGMSNKEKSVLLSNSTKLNMQKSFAADFNNVIIRSPEKYPTLSAKTKGPMDYINHYREMETAEVYLPYEEEFNWNTTEKLTVTYEQANNYTWSSGTRILYNSVGYNVGTESISYVDDNYAYNEPTMVLKSRDLFDIVKGPTPVTSYWQTSNVNHAYFTEDKIVRVVMPRVRMTSNYQGLFYGSNKLRFYRVYGELVTNEQGMITPSPTNCIVYSVEIKRRDARKQNWIDTPGCVWDQDWKMRKNTQRLVILLWHRVGRFFNASFSANVKIGWDFNMSSATAYATAELQGQVQVGECETVYDDILDRRVLMSSIVGDIGSGTINDGGVNYSVRNADRAQYYFKYHITEF